MRETSAHLARSPSQAPNAFFSLEFADEFDVAGCALDDRLEQLHRQFAAASRAASRAESELEVLEGRDDIHPHVLAQAKRQRAAVETRCALLMRAIDTLEERPEIE